MSASKTSMSAAFQRCISYVVTHDIMAKYGGIDFNASEAIYRHILRTMEKIIGAVSAHAQTGGEWDSNTFKLAVHKVLCPVTQSHDHSIGCVSDDLYLVYGVPLFNVNTQEGEFLLHLAKERILNESKKSGKQVSDQTANDLALELSKVANAIVLAIARQARELDPKSVALSEGAVKQVLAIPANLIYANDKTIPSLQTPNGDIDKKTEDARAAEETLLSNVTMERITLKKNKGDAKYNDSLYQFGGNHKDESVLANYTMDKNSDSVQPEPSVLANYTMDKNFDQTTVSKDEPSVLANYTVDKIADDVEPEESVVANYTMDRNAELPKDTEVYANYTYDKNIIDEDDESYNSDVSFGENSIPDLQPLPEEYKLPELPTYSDSESEEEQINDEGAGENIDPMLKDLPIAFDDDEDGDNYDEQISSEEEDDEDNYKYATGGTFTDDTEFVAATDFSAMRGGQDLDTDVNQFDDNEDGDLVSSGCGCSGGNKTGAKSVEYYNW